jgi:tRNA(fMet)-specific endonuclease VapC
VARRLRAAAQGEVGICSVVRGELIFGAYRGANPTRKLETLSLFLAQLESLPFDDAAADAYGLLRADLTEKGMIIGPNDLMIAAIAVANSVTIVTHSTSEFGRVVGLTVEDWQSSLPPVP